MSCPHALPPCPRKPRARGLTLLEVMVAVAVLSMVGVLIYGAAFGLTRSKTVVGHDNARYREGRAALRRINDELSAAFISSHQPISLALAVRTTIFAATNSSPADRLDFTAFSHIRVARDAHESDQAEISYFGSPDPDVSGKVDLARREQPIIDIDPRRGGQVNVLAEDIDLFDLRYLDPVSGMWQDTWDTTQATGQIGRLPLQIKVTLVLRDGPAGKNISFVSRVQPQMTTALNFAVPR